MKRLLHLSTLIVLFSGLYNFNYAQVGTTCTNPAVVSSVPYSATGLTAAGADYASLPCSGSFPNYMSGTDYVFSFTPSVTGNYSIALSNTGMGVGLFVTDLCPDEGGVSCVAYSTATTGNPIVSTVLNSGSQYYIIISSVSLVTPAATFDISIQFCNSNPPVAGFTYVQNGLTVDFTSTSTGADSWLWFFGDTDFFPFIPGDSTENPSHTYLAAGTYTVYLIAVNECGGDTISFSVTVAETSVQTIEIIPVVTFYPVPAHDFIKVCVGSNYYEDYSIGIYDISGKEIYLTQRKGSESLIYLNGLNTGLYFIKVSNGSINYRGLLPVK